MGRPEHVGQLREEVGEGKRLEGSLGPGRRLPCQPLSLLTCSSLFTTPPFLVCYQVLLSSSLVSRVHLCPSKYPATSYHPFSPGLVQRL